MFIGFLFITVGKIKSDRIIVVSFFLSDKKEIYMIYAKILCIRLYDAIRNFIYCKLCHINHAISCDTFMFSEHTLLIQLNYICMYDFDNYDETIAFQENYGELIH